MATQLQLRRGTTSETASFTGAVGEVTVDTTKDTLVVHDGSTAGGYELAKADGTNISFGDNVKATFGASDDLQIYHDGSNSIIYEGGTGDLQLRGNGGSTTIMNGGGTETLANFGNNGAVTLYYDNAVKLSTTATGIDIAGTVTSNDVNITDTTPNLKFTDTDGNHLANITQSGSHLYVDNDSTGNIRFRVDSNTERLTVNATGIDVTGTGTFSGEITANGGIALGDNDKATFGVGDDLQIYHNGNQSFIEDAGTGDLYIRAADNLRIQSYGDNEDMIKAVKDGAVTLYHNNAAKLATTSTGIDVAGFVNTDGIYLGGTGAANKLSDFETGSWTPTIVGSTSGSITGFTVSDATYTKIGDTVRLSCYLSSMNMTTSTVVGTYEIGGLPFSPDNFADVVSVAYCSMFSFDESTTSISGYCNGSVIRLLKGSSTSVVTDADSGSHTGAAIMISVTYKVA